MRDDQEKEIWRRMNEILESDERFEFSYLTLKKYHKKIFDGIDIGIDPENIGEFRKENLHKKEKILEGKEVKYADYEKIIEYLEYDFSEERKKRYIGMPNAVIVKNAVDFTSNIWQTHPFRDGNTRTIITFMQKYLKERGIETNKDVVFKNSEYIRNALVRANCSVLYNEIPENKIYLSRFYEVLLGIKKYNLDNNELYINQKNDIEIEIEK